ncbi:30S ribosomal protein S7 [Candidatus Saccharibacteria bacterium]|nr:30S ribosomal protein S7 [Candidatus Saccharibacteria bacterium]
MPRKITKSLKRELSPDLVYNSVVVTRFINKVMKNGKKRLAEKLVYDALTQAATKAKKDPLEIFDLAIKNASPQVQVRSRRVGGANYQVPMEVKPDRRVHYAMTWILDAARSKEGKSFDKLLANELLDASNNQGDAIKKKTDTHQMAEANKAFAHFARY